MSGTQKVFDALLAVQKAAPTLPKDKTATVPTKNGGSYQYRYTDLSTIVETVGPLLAEHGLVWASFPAHYEGTPVLRYQLAHAESGESIEGEMPLLLGGKLDSQGLGSALTYARRYALCAVLNLVSDDDDDGNTASSGPARTASQPGRTAQGVTASPAQLKFVKSLITKSKASREQLHAILERSGFDVVIEEGWLEKLTGGKQGSASALIDFLQNEPLPDLEHPSDVDSDTSGFEPTPEMLAEARRLADETFGVGTA